MEPKLLKMLSYKRPAGGKTEESFKKRYIFPFKPTVISTNLHICVPGGSGETLFSCHTDTVHRADGEQKVVFDANMGVAYVDEKDCLGADDTAGVWLMLEMIKAKIPGDYLFHYGEERGCIGSKQLSREHPELLKKFKRAVAFDRRGKTSIITFQASQRCCSDTFGKALAQELGHDYKLDPTGLWTDTASYTSLIPECTNISVGYEHQHCSDETQDVSHLLLLKDLVMKVKWDDLPTERDPTAKPHYIVPRNYEPPIQRQSHWQGRRSVSGFDSKRNWLSTGGEVDFDAEPYLNAMIDLIDDEVNLLHDAHLLVRAEPALAARMLYGAALRLYDKAARERKKQREAARKATDASLPVVIKPPHQKKLELVGVTEPT